MNKKWYLLIILGAAVIFLAREILAEYKFFTPEGSFAVEVSLESPGPTRLRIPMYRNAITSLEVVGDFAIGGTSATREELSSFLFAVSLERRELVAVLDLDSVIPGQKAIQSGFGKGPEGLLYAGTMPSGPGASGHVMSVQYQDGQFEVADLGVAVQREGIFSLAFDGERNRVYGITHPSGVFFSFDVASGKVREFRKTVPDMEALAYLYQYSLSPGDYLSRALVLDRQGRVYGSMPPNKLFRFDPESDEITLLEEEIPEVWGRHPLGRVDSWALAPDGTLYGGNAGDGQLFKLDPGSGKVVNLGKPIMMNRLKCLAWAGDGRLWGVAGGKPGYAHLFSFDTQAGFTDLGNPRFVLEDPVIPALYWRGFQIASMAVSEDGRWVVLGEEEDLSQLMVFPVR